MGFGQSMAPKIVEIADGLHNGGQIHEHPAFGMLEVARWTGGGEGVRMFGSDQRHRTGLTVKIKTAHTVRDLHREWHHDDELLVELTMSESQWARFVSSVGNGSGVPVTLCHYKTTGPVKAPGIEKPQESTKDLHSKEVRNGIERALGEAMSAVDELGKLIEDGKLSKKELRDIQRRLKIGLQNAPENAQYAFTQFDRAVERTVTEAQTEFDAYVSQTVGRLGLDKLRDMAPALETLSDSSGNSKSELE